MLNELGFDPLIDLAAAVFTTPNFLPQLLKHIEQQKEWKMFQNTNSLSVWIQKDIVIADNNIMDNIWQVIQPQTQYYFEYQSLQLWKEKLHLYICSLKLVWQ